MIIITK